MKRATSGAVTFLVLHEALRLTWRYFSDDPRTWFTAEPKAMLVSAMVFFLAGVGATAARHVSNADQVVWAAFQITVGATIMQTVVLFMQPWGPGNLFPISLAIGTVLIFYSTISAVALTAWATGWH